MEYSFEEPLKGITFWDEPVFDAHLHVWDARFYPKFVRWVEHYFNKFHCLGMMKPEVKNEIPEELASDIIFTYYIPFKHFWSYDIKEIIKEIEMIHDNNYDMIKIQFTPQIVDYVDGAKPGLRINDERFIPVFEKIEEYNYPVIMHIADPDTWYQTKYIDKERYGTKLGRLQDFMDIMDRHTKITFISAHLGSYPENLEKLQEMLDNYKQLYLDTGSTRWMARELSKDVEKSKKWFEKNSERILFGTDLSIIKIGNPEYWGTRYWVQKILWEENYKNIKLPFMDEDTLGNTVFSGLKLEKSA
jgi:hypothetical protein